MRYNHDDRIDTYNDWQQAQKIPINRGFFVEDLKKVEVATWEHKGGLGAFVNLDGAGGTNDGYVCEIPPGKAVKRSKASIRGDGLHPRRTWSDFYLAKRRQEAYFRMASGKSLCGSAQRSLSAFQRPGQRPRQIFCRHQCAVHDEPVSQSGFYLWR